MMLGFRIAGLDRMVTENIEDVISVSFDMHIWPQRVCMVAD